MGDRNPVPTSIPLLVGVTGRAQHGKDTTGQLLVSLGYKRFAFADALKSMALVLDPIVTHGENELGGPKHFRLAFLVEEWGWEEAKKSPEVRRFLQVLGTEAVRDHLGENAWVEALAHKAVPLFTNGVPVVVTDVRFPNEAAFIRRMGGELWRVKRVEQVMEDQSRVLTYVDFDNGLGKDHPSEAHVDELYADLEVTASTVEELESKLRGYIGKRGLRHEYDGANGPGRPTTRGATL